MMRSFGILESLTCAGDPIEDAGKAEHVPGDAQDHRPPNNRGEDWSLSNRNVGDVLQRN